MKSEKRVYRIKGFRDDGIGIRVLLSPYEAVRQTSNKGDPEELFRDPLGVANRLMQQGMQSMINDSFSISREEYMEKKYLVGEMVMVSIERLENESKVCGR